jgi:hypothetical protein
VTHSVRVLGAFLAVVVAAGVGLFAYDHVGSTTAPPTTTPPTSTSTTTTVPASTTTSTTVATTAACTGADLVGTIGPGQGAAGTVYATATLTNDTSVSCSIDGWPTLALLAGSKSLDATTDDSSSAFASLGGVPASPAPATIAPGGQVLFALAFTDVPTGTQSSCPNATTVLFTIAPSTASASLGLSDSDEISPCGQPPTVSVSPLYN